MRVAGKAPTSPLMAAVGVVQPNSIPPSMVVVVLCLGASEKSRGEGGRNNNVVINELADETKGLGGRRSENRMGRWWRSDVRGRRVKKVVF
jgi:hypothetical protein